MKKSQVGLRIEPELWEAVRVLAERDGVSMAEYVRRLVRRSVAQKTTKEAD